MVDNERPTTGLGPGVSPRQCPHTCDHLNNGLSFYLNKSRSKTELQLRRQDQFTGRVRKTYRDCGHGRVWHSDATPKPETGSAPGRTVLAVSRFAVLCRRAVLATSYVAGSVCREKLAIGVTRTVFGGKGYFGPKRLRHTAHVRYQLHPTWRVPIHAHENPGTHNTEDDEEVRQLPNRGPSGGA